MAKGLDCGTSYYITATEDSIKKQRNVFLTVDGDANQVKRMLKRQRIPFVEKAGKVHIVGQHAFNYAQIFSQTELKRPMKSGLLNPGEKDALPVLHAIIGELIGNSEDNEVCVYCVPSAPIDQDRRVDYHEDVLQTIIEGYGYKAKKIEEAVAIGYEGLVDDDLTGIAISMGAGMCNIAVMYAGMTALSFSVARGGDWVDQNVSADTGIQVAKAQNLKEKSTGLNIKGSKLNDIYEEDSEEGNVIRAISSYYGALINYLMTNLKHQFENTADIPQFPDAVPIVIGGGTSLVNGFIDIFKDTFDDSDFPIPISEIRLIEDAHTAVSRGCLSEAQLIEEEEGESDEKSA
jgi:actin-like ATPase involved in cell morphogenesis